MSARAFVTGASGTGKSALVRTLCSLGIKAVDMDEAPGLARWENRETGTPASWYPDAGEEWHASHDWVVSPDRLDDLLRGRSLRVVAGLAANQSTFLHRFDATLLLRCSERTFLRRIAERTDNRYGRERSERLRILSTYRQMETEMLDLGAVPIDSERDVGLVARDVVRLLDGNSR